MNHTNQDLVSLDEINTLGELFLKRVEKTPDRVAYRHYDTTRGNWCDTSWREMAQHTAHWQAALRAEGLAAGDRVGMMMPNCREWVMFDQASFGLGLINVPLFFNDRGGNVAYIAEDAGIQLLVVHGEEQWQSIQPVLDQLVTVRRIVTIQRLAQVADDERVCHISDWLPETSDGYQVNPDLDANGMATIVYTSGTTGHPKGVMLSHRNILCNAAEALQTTTLYADDILLSFLPLSHMLERTGGYYLAMMAGVAVAYARSIADLGEDLLTIRPTLMISVPRIYERVYAKIEQGLKAKSAFARGLFQKAVDIGWQRHEYQLGRANWTPALLLWPLLKKLVADKITAKLGGRLRTAISGGAPLAQEVAKTFLALGVPILQGYGLTETSPVLAVNRIESNTPESVGQALSGVTLKVAEDGELLAKGTPVMIGFWKRPQETARVFDEDGWFHTGDIARIDDQGFVYITGRIKDIIVLANGEKVSPSDMEIAIAMDALFEQVLVIGEGRPYLSALIVPEPGHWHSLAEGLGISPDDPASYRHQQVIDLVLQRINRQLRDFPGYAQVRKACLLPEAWSIENGFLTPTLKIKRSKVLQHLESVVNELYKGH